MKFTCEVQDMLRSIQTVARATTGRSTLPILANIHIEVTEKGQVQLYATDLEHSIRVRMEAAVMESGATTVPSKLFSDLVSSLPNGRVEVESQDETYILSVRTPRTSANIRGMSPQEYPVYQASVQDEPLAILDASYIKDIVSSVAFAAAKDESRPVLASVLMRFTPSSITLVAADAFRLAARTDTAILSATAQDLLVPANALSDLMRILPTQGAVEIRTPGTKGQVLFSMPDLDLWTRLNEGTFPDFTRIVPTQYRVRAVMNTGDFLTAAKSVLPFTDKTCVSRLTIADGTDGASGSITIDASTEEVGDNVSAFDANVEGESLQVMLNVKYLTEFLGILGAQEEVTFQVQEPSRPLLFFPVKNSNYKYVVMPMTTNR